jgi:hypothetical protein
MLDWNSCRIDDIPTKIRSKLFTETHPIPPFSKSNFTVSKYTTVTLQCTSDLLSKVFTNLFY